MEFTRLSAASRAGPPNTAGDPQQDAEILIRILVLILTLILMLILC